MGKTYSISDIVTGGYVGLRFGEPLLYMAKGEWTGDQVMTEWAYRFGAVGSDGQFAPAGAIQTYLPPLAIQLLKKGMRRLMGRSISIGPLRFP